MPLPSRALPAVENSCWKRLHRAPKLSAAPCEYHRSMPVVCAPMVGKGIGLWMSKMSAISDRGSEPYFETCVCTQRTSLPEKTCSSCGAAAALAMHCTVLTSARSEMAMACATVIGAALLPPHSLSCSTTTTCSGAANFCVIKGKHLASAPAAPPHTVAALLKSDNLIISRLSLTTSAAAFRSATSWSAACRLRSPSNEKGLVTATTATTPFERACCTKSSTAAEPSGELPDAITKASPEAPLTSCAAGAAAPCSACRRVWTLLDGRWPAGGTFGQ